MRLPSFLIILFVVSAVWTVCESKSSRTSPSSKSKVSHQSKSSGSDHSKKPHHEAGHQTDGHDHSKTSHRHKSKHEDKPKSQKKKNENKHLDEHEGKIKLTTHRPVQKTTLMKDDGVKTKKRGHKNKHRTEATTTTTTTTTTTALPGVVVHRKQSVGGNVTNNGTSGVGVLIDAPFIECPAGQRRLRGECRNVFR